jgi:DNA-binding transcriptional LysR family regulator
MQIETLKVFCDLVESRSFSRAAVRNFITQSAVSQQVKNLEIRFETQLLRRDGKSVTACGTDILRTVSHNPGQL